ncbi:MAG: hypothetical protein ACRDHL_13315 [Candidatus Promineifilaceae bacterium]
MKDLLSRAIFPPVILLGLLALGPAAPVAAVQEEPSAIQLSATAGFDGFYRPGYWTPLRANLANDGPPVEGRLEVVTRSSLSPAPNERDFSAPVALPTQSNKRLRLYFYLDTGQSAAQLQWVAGGRPTTFPSPRLRPVDPETLLYGVLTSAPGGFDFLEDVSGGRRDAEVAYLELDGLPDVPAAWSALDVLIVHDLDTGDIGGPQLAALRGWLATGGQIVVAGGPAWQRTTAGLLDLLPVRPTGADHSAELPGLGDFGAEPPAGPFLLAASELVGGGEALALHNTTPLLAVRRHGQGKLYFLALDPLAGSLAEWDGREALFAPAAEAVPRPSVFSAGIQQSFNASEAVSALPELDLPSASLVACFLGLYVMLVGPINYLYLLARGRRELAWVTIPAVVLGFTLLAFVIGAALRDSQAVLNEMAVAHGQVGGPTVRVESVYGFYSPQRRRLDITFPADALGRPLDERLPSMGASAVGSGRVERSDVTRLVDVRLDGGEVATFVATAYRPAPAVAGEVELAFDSGQAELAIQLRNEGNALLEDAALLVGGTAIGLGDIAAGGTISRSERLAGLGLGSGGASPGMPGSSVFGGANLLDHADTLLGTSSYYNDPVAYPRYQLLQAVSQYDDTLSAFPASGTAMLVAWSSASQIDVQTGVEDVEQRATTLYFLKLPLRRRDAAAEPNGAEPVLWMYHLLNSNDPMNGAPTDLYLAPASLIEFEFQPLVELRPSRPISLSLSLEPASGGAEPLPEVSLWDWQAGRWREVAVGDWGEIVIAEYEPFVAGDGRLRVRLENRGLEGIGISRAWPLMGLAAE